jgi:hypothetical protein
MLVQGTVRIYGGKCWSRHRVVMYRRLVGYSFLSVSLLPLCGMRTRVRFLVSYRMSPVVIRFRFKGPLGYMERNAGLWLPWLVLASTGPVLHSTHFVSVTMWVLCIVPMGTIGYYSAAGYYGYCIVPTGTAVVPTGTTVL